MIFCGFLCIVCVFVLFLRYIYASPLEVHIRVPTFGGIYTRPKLHPPIYASQIEVHIRVPNELFIKVQVVGVCGYASQIVGYIRVPTCVYIRVPTCGGIYTRPNLCIYTRPNLCIVYEFCIFYVFSMVFYDILWFSMVFYVFLCIFCRI